MGGLDKKWNEELRADRKRRGGPGEEENQAVTSKRQKAMIRPLAGFSWVVAIALLPSNTAHARTDVHNAKTRRTGLSGFLYIAFFTSCRPYDRIT
jgi:hypothetical protein